MKVDVKIMVFHYVMSCSHEESGQHFGGFLQISPTRCTILRNIFISLLYMFRAFTCPSSGENYCIFVTLVLSLYMGGVWSAGWIQSNQQTRHHPYRVTNTSVAGYSNFLLMMGTWMPETCRKVK